MEKEYVGNAEEVSSQMTALVALVIAFFVTPAYLLKRYPWIGYITYGVLGAAFELLYSRLWGFSKTEALILGFASMYTLVTLTIFLLCAVSSRVEKWFASIWS